MIGQKLFEMILEYEALDKLSSSYSGIGYYVDSSRKAIIEEYGGFPPKGEIDRLKKLNKIINKITK